MQMQCQTRAPTAPQSAACQCMHRVCGHVFMYFDYPHEVFHTRCFFESGSFELCSSSHCKPICLRQYSTRSPLSTYRALYRHFKVARPQHREG
jgi:hypothetical protein